MKSNFNELFEELLPDLKQSGDIDIEQILDDVMPEVRFYDRVSKSDLARSFIRGRLTTAMNLNQIYSYEKGHFVSLESANEEQLNYFMEKADRDSKAAAARKAKAEARMYQISLAWDGDGNFVGFHIPEAVNL